MKHTRYTQPWQESSVEYFATKKESDSLNLDFFNWDDGLVDRDGEEILAQANRIALKSLDNAISNPLA
jgi:hypothetical protein